MAGLVTAVSSMLGSTMTSLGNLVTGNVPKPEIPEPPKLSDNPNVPNKSLSSEAVKQRQDKIRQLQAMGQKQTNTQSNIFTGNRGDMSMQNNQKTLLGQ
jgi:hypothetical protein